MRVVVEKSNLKGTVNWLRNNDEVFRTYDEDQATEKLSANLKRFLEPLSMEVADSDAYTCIVWTGVMASVSAGRVNGQPDDAREVMMWCAPSAPGGMGHQSI